jgi:hypothetical protein
MYSNKMKIVMKTQNYTKKCTLSTGTPIDSVTSMIIQCNDNCLIVRQLVAVSFRGLTKLTPQCNHENSCLNGRQWCHLGLVGYRNQPPLCNYCPLVIMRILETRITSPTFGAV